MKLLFVNTYTCRMHKYCAACICRIEQQARDAFGNDHSILCFVLFLFFAFTVSTFCSSARSCSLANLDRTTYERKKTKQHDKKKTIMSDELKNWQWQTPASITYEANEETEPLNAFRIQTVHLILYLYRLLAT